MSLDAEAQHVLGLITHNPTFNGRQLIWRGYKFQQWRPGHDPEVWETVVVVINWGPDRLNDLEWAHACVTSIKEPPSWLHTAPVDGVPAEIHAIADFEAYMSALAAYREAVT